MNEDKYKFLKCEYNSIKKMLNTFPIENVIDRGCLESRLEEIKEELKLYEGINEYE